MAYRFATSIAVVALALSSCGKPTAPESILQQDGRFSFVSSDHYFAQKEFRVLSYAYVTILGFAWEDSVTFTTADGDSERVAMHFVAPGHEFDYNHTFARGAVIYLSLADSKPNDGILGFGRIGGMPKAGIRIEAKVDSYEGTTAVTNALVLP